jgi:hypothetical protein
MTGRKTAQQLQVSATKKERIIHRRYYKKSKRDPQEDCGGLKTGTQMMCSWVKAPNT